MQSKGGVPCIKVQLGSGVPYVEKKTQLGSGVSYIEECNQGVVYPVQKYN